MGTVRGTYLHPVHVDASTDAILLANQTQLGDTVEEAIVELWRQRGGVHFLTVGGTEGQTGRRRCRDVPG